MGNWELFSFILKLCSLDTFVFSHWLLWAVLSTRSWESCFLCCYWDIQCPASLAAELADCSQDADCLKKKKDISKPLNLECRYKKDRHHILFFADKFLFLT